MTISPLTHKPVKRLRPHLPRLIYAIYTPQNECLYVGCTICPAQRWKELQREEGIKGRKCWMSIIRKAPYPRSHVLEARIIQAYKRKGQARLNRNQSLGALHPSALRWGTYKGRSYVVEQLACQGRLAASLS